MEKQIMQFKEMQIASKGVAVHIAEPKHGAGTKQSMRALEDAGMRPITYQEFFVLIGSSPELKRRLQGNWFYLAGKGLEEGGYYKIDFKTGQIEKINSEKRKTLSAEDIVYLQSGENQLAMIVNQNDVTGFDLHANFIMSGAPLILGVYKSVPNLAPQAASSFSAAGLDKTYLSASSTDVVLDIALKSAVIAVEAVRAGIQIVNDFKKLSRIREEERGNKRTDF